MSRLGRGQALPHLLIPLLVLLLADANPGGAEPDPVETDDEDEVDPKPPIGGHWGTLAQAKQVCELVCVRAYPKCDSLGCAPARATAVQEVCQYTCCGDTSHTYCWNCLEVGPGETPPAPPVTCKPSPTSQKVSKKNDLAASKLSDKPPPFDSEPAPGDPIEVLEKAAALYSHEPPASKGPKTSIPGAPTAQPKIPSPLATPPTVAGQAETSDPPPSPDRPSSSSELTSGDGNSGAPKPDGTPEIAPQLPKGKNSIAPTASNTHAGRTPLKRTELGATTTTFSAPLSQSNHASGTTKPDPLDTVHVLNK